MTYIFFTFRWMTRNAERSMDPFTIPVHYQQILLPDPACSISELFEFPFLPKPTLPVIAESSFVECVDNITVDVTPRGRGLRKKRKKVLYSSNWWVDNSTSDSDES